MPSREATTVRATANGADALRRLAGTLAAQTGRHVTAGQAMEAAIAVASQQIPAVITALSEVESR